MGAKKKKKAVPPKPPAPEPAAPIEKYPIVGIGASAGGLEAIEAFLRNVPAQSGLAFVIVQHLDPTHKGILVELLQRAATIPVTQVEDSMKVEPNHVYVIPPNKDLSILHGVLHLMPPIAPRGLNLPIDLFFRSLADDQRERSIGVVLSGMGSDGTLGLRAIKEHAGATFAQAPASAKFDSMPRSAIDAGLVDVVAAVEELPARIIAYSSYVPHVGRAESELGDRAQSSLEKIFILLRTETGNDFSLYKKSTILRRIERRMGLHQIDQIERYVRYLRENPQETQLLFKELLIGVTSFFRDLPAWEQLAHDVLPALIKSRQSGTTLRAWVPGCSTGEEAYSLAIAFKEAVEKHQKNMVLQIFATDLDRDAIESARLGVFGENIAADVSPERLRRFFVQDDRGFRVSKDIREMVIFAPQNLIMDPPFTKLDILSCRNVLIYLAPELQKKIIPLFHYSLNPGGILLLGSAETVGTFTNLFAPVDGGKMRIYRRLEALDAQVEFPAVHFRGVSMPPSADDERPKPAANIQTLADRILVQRYSPAGILCTEKGDILYIGGRTGKYLEPAMGHANWNILVMARDGLRYELGAAFSAAVRENRTVVVRGVQIGTNGGTQAVDITVERLTEPEPLRGSVMVVITDVPTPPKIATPVRLKHARDTKVTELEDELNLARQEGQSLREEMQTSQEELKSTNEELQSTNEELQSTNEELTTSKEEMQSLNEELQTLNHELQAKVEELSRSNNDMKNLLNSTDIATLFLDSELRVRRFTTQTAKLIKLIPGDAGRPVTDLAMDLDYPELADDAREVLRTLVYREKVVGTKSGRYFAVRILPYRTLENVIDGVVITFTDATLVKDLEKQLREHGAQLGQTLDALPVLWLGFHASGACDAVGKQWIAYTGRSAREQLGHRWLEQVHSEDQPAASAAWAAAVKKGEPFTTDLRIRSHAGQHRWFRLHIVPIRGTAGVEKWYGSATDIEDLRARDLTPR